MCCKRSERVRVEWTQSDHLQCNCWAFGVYMKVIWLIMPLLSWLCEKASEAIWIALNGFFAFRYNFSSTTWCIMVSHLSRGLRTYTRYFSGGSIGAIDRSLHISLDGEFGSFVHNRDVKSFARWLLPWAVCLARETVKNCRLLLSCWSRCGGFGRKTFLFRKPIPRRLNRKSCRNIKKSLLFGLSRFIWLLYDFFPFDDKYSSAPAHSHVESEGEIEAWTANRKSLSSRPFDFTRANPLHRNTKLKCIFTTEMQWSPFLLSPNSTVSYWRIFMRTQTRTKQFISCMRGRGFRPGKCFAKVVKIEIFFRKKKNYFAKVYFFRTNKRSIRYW